jgi:hypothetical protein
VLRFAARLDLRGVLALRELATQLLAQLLEISHRAIRLHCVCRVRRR